MICTIIGISIMILFGIPIILFCIAMFLFIFFGSISILKDMFEFFKER